jgi:hypothetical protein
MLRVSPFATGEEHAFDIAAESGSGFRTKIICAQRTYAGSPWRASANLPAQNLRT